MHETFQQSHFHTNILKIRRCFFHLTNEDSEDVAEELNSISESKLQKHPFLNSSYYRILDELSYSYDFHDKSSCASMVKSLCNICFNLYPCCDGAMPNLLRILQTDCETGFATSWFPTICFNAPVVCSAAFLIISEAAKIDALRFAHLAPPLSFEFLSLLPVANACIHRKRTESSSFTISSILFLDGAPNFCCKFCTFVSEEQSSTE
mmetsp:Transcript_12804/g.15675  ORF Transcript_12804/g.15675 Transcript_12804/m.15675 type:complete len:207 (+) Transcript_12804:85-705(+)